MSQANTLISAYGKTARKRTHLHTHSHLYAAIKIHEYTVRDHFPIGQPVTSDPSSGNKQFSSPLGGVTSVQSSVLFFLHLHLSHPSLLTFSSPLRLVFSKLVCGVSFPVTTPGTHTRKRVEKNFDFVNYENWRFIYLFIYYNL